MAIKMVREPSETPNINNVDDIIPFRYAYSGQNGYVIGKGTEISNTINGSNFIVNSGRLVLQGVECDIDATGVTIAVDNIVTKRYYVVYLQVNLATNQVIINSKYDTADYPVIDSGDDLTENSSGIAKMILYKFIATKGIITEVNKVVESIKYIDENFIKNVKVDNSTNADNSKKINNIEIMQDEIGLLKINNFIIPQKKTIWTGNANIVDASIELNENVNAGDVLEITFSDSQNGFIVYKQKIFLEKIFSGSSNQITSNLYYIYSADASQIYTISVRLGLIDGSNIITGSYYVSNPSQSNKSLYIKKVEKVIE